MSSGFSIQCKVRQCTQCQGDTEFYCNTCKHDLCLQCKEKHVIDLATIYHDVVIYREKYEYIPKQETCSRHPGKIYEMFCQSCDLPACAQCKEHRKHKILDIRTAYKTNRQLHAEIIHNIRSETLYNSRFLLAGIKIDINNFHTEIPHQSEMSTKAQRLKNLIHIVTCDFKIRCESMLNRLQEQKRKMNRHLRSIENQEHRFEQSANRPVKFLLLLKKTRLLKIKDTPNLTQHAQRSLIREINKEDVIKLLSEIQIMEKGKRQLRNECLLKLMSSPVLHRSVKLTGVRGVIHISFVKSDLVWISDDHNLILTNTEGEALHHLTDIACYEWNYGVHTVNIAYDLIYIDIDQNINKLSKDNITKCTLIKKPESYSPCCVYSSPFNGDLLVGMENTDTFSEAKVARYNDTGKHIQTIQHNSTGPELYEQPSYITENRNGDVIVSDLRRGVVVTERGGRHRFSYIGRPSGSQLLPGGLCTDALSNILVCDNNTQSLQMIDQNGHFLSQIKIQQWIICSPGTLSYDDKTHLFWFGSYCSETVRVYRCIKRQDYLRELQDPHVLDP